MTNARLFPALLSLSMAVTPLAVRAQQSPPPARPYPVGNPLGLPIVPTADGQFSPISSNVKVYGSVYSAESCSYDPERDLIVVPNRGVPPSVRVNDAWITFLNHDGSVHTSRWIGVQNSGPQRDTLSPPLLLNEPFGSDIVRGVLYLADRDGGADPSAPIISVVRRFDMRTGAPLGAIPVPGASWLNDIAVGRDGTVYGTVTGEGQLWRVLPDGQASILVQGAPLNRPNGVAIDREGNIVIVNVGSDSVLTFSSAGRLTRTERAVQSGNDGIVIMDDGTKYVSSVVNGGISRIRPGQAAELIAENIPNAASMCYDAGAKQLVIPMNANNALAFLQLPPEGGPAGTLIVSNMNDHTVTMVDAASGRVIATLPTGEGPHEVAASRDGRLAMVSNYGVRGRPGKTLTVIDVARATVVRTLTLPDSLRPHGIAFLPGDTLVAVTSERQQAVFVVDARDGRVVSRLATRGRVSHMLALTADGRRLATANIGDGNVSRVDVAGRDSTALSAVGGQPEAVAITPDGRWIWAGSNRDSIVVIVDASKSIAVDTIRGFGMPYRIVITPDGRTAVISDPVKGEIRAFNVADRKAKFTILVPRDSVVATAEVPGSPAPEGVAISRDSRWAYVTLQGRNRVVWVDLVRGVITASAPTGVWSDGIAYSPITSRDR